MFQRLLVLRSPGLSIRQIRRVALEIAMLISLGDSRPLHHQPCALFHSALTRHRHAARRAILPRRQLPSRPPANCAIFSSHDHPLECGSLLPLLRPQPLTQTICLLNRGNLPALFRQPPSYVPIRTATIGLPCGNLCTKTKTPRSTRGFTDGVKLETHHFSISPPAAPLSQSPSSALFLPSAPSATIPAAPRAQTRPSAVPSRSSFLSYLK